MVCKGGRICTTKVSRFIRDVLLHTVKTSETSVKTFSLKC